MKIRPPFQSKVLSACVILGLAITVVAIIYTLATGHWRQGRVIGTIGGFIFVIAMYTGTWNSKRKRGK